MKDILIQALDTAFEVMNSVPPQTKRVVKKISIDNVEPLQLQRFIKDNNIPKRAYFGGHGNVEEGESEAFLCWDIEEPLSSVEQRKHDIKKFDRQAWYTVYKWLTNEGYKRCGCNTSEFKQFEDTTILDMYIENDFDRLAKYYSLFFKKESEK